MHMATILFAFVLNAGVSECDQTGAAEGISSPAKSSSPAEGPVSAFESIDDQGQPWKSSDHIGKSIVVLYFYPGDFTGGCIPQAEAFREGLQKLRDAGIEVVGVSGDSAETHRLFKEAYGLKHTLLADPEGALARQLGIPVQAGGKVRTRGPDGQPLMDEKGKSIIVHRSVTFPRWTLVIDRDGKLASKRTNVPPATDADEIVKLAETIHRRAME
jgi:thioredoxin-dependent peroxiredoxin